MTRRWSAWIDRARFSAGGLAATRFVKRARRRAAARGAAVRPGRCNLCARDAGFLVLSDNPRDGQVCVWCGSVPRQRALVAGPAMTQLAACTVHESSPSLCTYDFLRRRAREYVPSYHWPDTSRSRVGPFENVDLQRQPFADDRFDFVVTQDVLEHVPDPATALREIYRTLRPGGRHVFTVPTDSAAETRVRARFTPDGVEHLLPPEYHRDPTTKTGALVVTDWGNDVCERVAELTGARCEAERCEDEALGIYSALECFVMTKA